MASRAGVHGGWGQPNAWVQRTVEQRSRPVGHYTVSKVFIESIGYSYAQQHGMAIVCVRIGNFVSPFYHLVRFVLTYPVVVYIIGL